MPGCDEHQRRLGVRIRQFVNVSRKAQLVTDQLRMQPCFDPRYRFSGCYGLCLATVAELDGGLARPNSCGVTYQRLSSAMSLLV